jgi:Uma2 family endonuclease
MHVQPAPDTSAAIGRLTVERYLALVDTGVLDPDDRVELLAGVVVSMSPINSPHATAVGLVDEALRRAFPDGVAIRVQQPLVLAPFSMPQPDLVVVPGTHRDYSLAHPTTALLVVEVSDSSLPQDRLTKGAIYAAAGIPEYWIVNLRHRQLEVHRSPDVEGAGWSEVLVLRPGDAVTPAVPASATIAIADLLP